MNLNSLFEPYDSKTLPIDIKNNRHAVSIYKNAIQQAQKILYQQFDRGVEVDELIHSRSKFIDQVLSLCWQSFIGHEDQTCLIAVGGYGRSELHPHSDIDILILFQNDNIEQHQSALESFITFLWDIGLEIGSSVRDIKQCIAEAKNDITIATNIVESRFVCGSHVVFENYEHATSPALIWSGKDFFEGKRKEQLKRYARFHNTSYNLEPNIKESPGGLRDIHMIGWIAKRHFGDKSLSDLVRRNFLTTAEYRNLIYGQEFLWKTRFALHKLTGRHEDRLLFEYQRILADQFGFKDEPANSGQKFTDVSTRPSDGHRLPVEIFMKQYYRVIGELNLLNEIILQHFEETILFPDEPEEKKPLNKRFQSVNGFIDVVHVRTFTNYPFALLEIFLLLQINPELKGIRASTLRLMRESLHLINDEFRNDIRCKSLFVEILKQPTGLTHQLRLMNRYGILGNYLPEFGMIIGQMQFDLFHAYTVDEHTLFVVRNIRRYSLEKYAHEFPVCSYLFKTIPKPELLYISALYHDIAKGRGGNHSVLGEVDARNFCLRHGFSHYDSELVAWLVRNHLLMSSTAQNKDLSDPDVINGFANQVENSIKLDYLYLLTVADIRATNDTLWNSWKDSLLRTLRLETKNALRRGLDNPLQKEEFIQQTQNAALKRIATTQLDVDHIMQFWANLGDDYFLRYTPEEILSHCQATARSPEADTVINIDKDSVTGGTDVFVKTPASKQLFAATTKVLNTLHLNIVEAKIVTSKNHYSLNTYTVLEHNGETVSNPHRVEEIRQAILYAIQDNTPLKKPVSQNLSAKIQCFFQPTEMTFETDINNQWTIIEILTTDRPGILSLIAYEFAHHNVQIENAKITTLGAQVDDVFKVFDGNTGKALSVTTILGLKKELTELLDNQ